ncbi:RHS repeat-associated core domain-containing protein, partial [Halomonas sp. ML-15]|uniref:RHS repeat-associated core domain-containing protein n=1 Tax=Halomonas sp. ML-15 TaxID=2773305 RepID=UPI00174725BE
HDEESGLYYNRHRYYDPQQGRYISQDPIGLNGGTNLYGYVTNPTGMVDPLGLEGIVDRRMRPDSRTLMGMRGLDPRNNNQIIESCMSDLKDWLDMADYSGAVDARNTVFAALRKQPSAGLLASFSKQALMQGACSSMNNNGNLVDEISGEVISDFSVWPGPVPQEILDLRQLDIPNDPGAQARRTLEQGAYGMFFR